MALSQRQRDAPWRFRSARDVLADVRSHLAPNPAAIGSLLHASLNPPGQQAIVDGAHGRWLAEALIKQLSRVVTEQRPARIQLFVACPVNLLLKLMSDRYILAEAVYAVLEVKAAPRKEELIYAANKARSVRRLKRLQDLGTCPAVDWLRYRNVLSGHPADPAAPA